MKKDNTQLLTVLCEQLQYGLNVKICDVYSHEKDKTYQLDPNTIGIDVDKIGIKEVLSHGKLALPILHEMDLTKPITVDGETFVPIDQLENIDGFEYLKLNTEKKLLPEITWLRMGVVEYLNKWHFNWRKLPESDYIKVSSLAKSPYA